MFGSSPTGVTMNEKERSQIDGENLAVLARMVCQRAKEHIEKPSQDTFDNLTLASSLYEEARVVISHQKQVRNRQHLKLVE